MSSEVIASNDMSDVPFILERKLLMVLIRKLPIQLLTNNKSLFDFI